jgi:hypothetical protein
MNYNKKKLKKLLFGSGATDPLQKYEQIKRQRRADNPGTIQSPNEALMENDIMMSNAMLDSNKDINVILDALGAMGMQTGMNMMSGGITDLLNKEKPYGGKGKGLVEIEGGEVIESPGNMLEGVGPDHSGGGIPALMKPGDVVWSKRIKIKGESLADSAKKMEKTERKLDKLLEDNETDTLLKNTRDRVDEVHDTKKKEALMLQTTVNEFMGKGENNEMPFGTSIFEILQNLNKNPLDVNAAQELSTDAFHTGDNSLDYSSKIPLKNPFSTGIIRREGAKIDAPLIDNENTPSVEEEVTNLPTAGDALGVSPALFLKVFFIGSVIPLY